VLLVRACRFAALTLSRSTTWYDDVLLMDPRARTCVCISACVRSALHSALCLLHTLGRADTRSLRARSGGGFPGRHKHTATLLQNAAGARAAALHCTRLLPLSLRWCV
jgi:hypothetical protein